MRYEPVGVAEIAARTGRTHAAVHHWRKVGLLDPAGVRVPLPAPQGVVNGRPAWDLPVIMAWCKQVGLTMT